MKSEDLLKEYVKHIINENQDVSEDLAFYRAGMNNNGKVQHVGIAYDVNKVKIAINNMGNDFNKMKFQKSIESAIVGLIVIQKPDFPCNNAYEVKLAAGKGRGKLVYDMGYYMANNCYLIPDRENISADAQRAWKNVRDTKSEGIPLENHKKKYLKNPSAACKVWDVNNREQREFVDDESTADALNRAYCLPSGTYNFEEMAKKTDLMLAMISNASGSLMGRDVIFGIMAYVAKKFFERYST